MLTDDETIIYIFIKVHGVWKSLKRSHYTMVKQCNKTGQFEKWWKMPKIKWDILSDFQTL